MRTVVHIAVIAAATFAGELYGYHVGLRAGQIQALTGHATIRLEQNDRGETVWKDVVK